MTDPTPPGPHLYAQMVAAMARLDADPGAPPPPAFAQAFAHWTGTQAQTPWSYLRLDAPRRLCVPAPPAPSPRVTLSPEDHDRRGKGLTIRWGRFASPFGPTLAMATERGLCGLAFSAQVGEDPAMADLRGRWPGASYLADAPALAAMVQAAFEDPAPVPLDLIGAPFQLQVWQTLLGIAPGWVTTYTDIARAIGTPKAVRAVGTAVGRNPVSWLVPCHRALRRDGALGGYHWGLPVKRAMLAWEAARADVG